MQFFEIFTVNERTKLGEMLAGRFENLNWEWSSSTAFGRLSQRTRPNHMQTFSIVAAMSLWKVHFVVVRVRFDGGILLALKRSSIMYQLAVNCRELGHRLLHWGPIKVRSPCMSLINSCFSNISTRINIFVIILIKYELNCFFLFPKLIVYEKIVFFDFFLLPFQRANDAQNCFHSGFHRFTPHWIFKESGKRILSIVNHLIEFSWFSSNCCYLISNHYMFFFFQR